jgi:hypothetical protein
MLWWIWCILGFVLLVAELFMPSGFVLAVFGAAALLTGMLVAIGLGGPLWLEWIIWGVLMVALLVGVRKRLVGQRSNKIKEGSSELIGEEVLLQENVAPGASGRGELRGAGWTVKNTGPGVLQAGERYAVERVESLTLLVRGK